ncbi:CopG family transcriptional regulator [Clostridium perfringens]|uniref:CopG family transcriptional regulator n=1 Tax=Clostridium perfringens TaxID=1502 RepID=UPI0003FE4ED9|nr:CopG family transcriptional regulator [Clostridium perfringens]EJT6478475.1 CopG family transcriptional regulator [Clostridium perfringens]
MSTKNVKDAVIRVRVTKEHKEKLKQLAEEQNTTISEIINVATINLIKEHEEKTKNKEKLYARVVATEEKIQEIKSKLEQRKLEKNKSLKDKALRKLFK